jgi:hypothetical protein
LHGTILPQKLHKANRIAARALKQGEHANDGTAYTFAGLDVPHRKCLCNMKFRWQNTAMGNKRTTQEIACQQVLVEDSSVFSIQWSIFPLAIAAELTPGTLLDRYLAYIRRSTFSVITPTRSPAGIEFRLMGSSLSLISFQEPDVNEQSIVLRICGGMLVQPRQCDRGELHFSVSSSDDGIKVSLQLSDYCPLLLGSSSPSLLRRWLYQFTQAAIHRLVTVRFLSLLYQDLAGTSAKFQVVNVQVRDGKSI